MKIAAPAKIILSGEHAVVYGKPALALAVDRYATTTITKESRPGILFDFHNLKHRSHLNEMVLKILKNKIENKYQRFKNGDLSIRKVLKKPFELAQFAFSTVTDTLKLSLPHGIKISVQSDVPMGCGMGSSAATIVSIVAAVSNYLEKPLEDDELFKLALDAENKQHGLSSGIDLRIAQRGGCIYFKNSPQQLTARIMPHWPLYVVNTGEPVSSTGECVAHAKNLIHPHLDEFETVTKQVDEAMQNKSYPDFMQAIKKNHRLLTAIEVVPLKVQKFIDEIEHANGAAKICGAGSVQGDNAGVVIIAAEDQAAIESVCSKFNYQLLPIKAETRGVHVV